MLKNKPPPTTFLVVLLLSGCLQYKQPTTSFANKKAATTNESYADFRLRAAEQPQYSIVPRDRKQIYWYDAPHWLAWTFLGNERDGIFGEDVNPPFSTSLNNQTFWAWQIRNPFSNFCFYVIGSGDWTTHHSFSLVRSDSTGTHLLQNEISPAVFAQGKSGVIVAFNDYKPFISWKFPIGKSHQFDFYLGWRPDGHFGAKFRPYIKTKARNQSATTYNAP